MAEMEEYTGAEIAVGGDVVKLFKKPYLRIVPRRQRTMIGSIGLSNARRESWGVVQNYQFLLRDHYRLGNG